MSFWVLLALLAPLSGALAATALQGRSRGPFLAAAALATLFAGLALAAGTLAGGQPLQYLVGGWPVPLGIRLYVDGLSSLLLAATSLIGGGITLYARYYFASAQGGRHAFFWPLWFLMWTGLNGLFLAGDVFNVYVMLELINLSAVALVALPRTAESLRAALRYLVIAFLGSLSYLFGVGLLYVAQGQLDLQGLAATASATPSLALAGCLMLLGLMIKTALFPMHSWLPPAHAVAPAPVSAMLSGLVVTASAYLLIRLAFTLFAPLLDTPLAALIGAMGAMAVLWGSINALLQRRMKMVIAYSTVAQLGYVFLLFPLASVNAELATFAWYGGIYFAVCHAFAKAGAFLAVGTVMRATGHDRIAQLAGVGMRLPMALFAFALAGVNLIGLPPSGGFIAKWLLLRSSLDAGMPAIAAVIVAGSLLAAAYVFRILEGCFAEDPRADVRTDLPPGLAWSALFLALLPILLGFFSGTPLSLLAVGSPVGAMP